jgi:hypothetical protein
MALITGEFPFSCPPPQAGNTRLEWGPICFKRSLKRCSAGFVLEKPWHSGNRFAVTLTEGCNGQDSDQEKTRKTPRSFLIRQSLASSVCEYHAVNVFRHFFGAEYLQKIRIPCRIHEFGSKIGPNFLKWTGERVANSRAAHCASATAALPMPAIQCL